VTNLGRRRRANPAAYGFPLDLVKGRWLTEKQNAEKDEERDDLEAGAEDVVRKATVIPFVEDRRNVLVLRWAGRVGESEAVTLQYAVERGMEAVFQLEDSELTSQLLPDADERGRTMFVEAAEGGAGVLRRLQGEPDQLAAVAVEALKIMHVDPGSGQDVDGACVRGCYRCLLSYSNQTVHEAIDRRLAIDRLMALTSGRVEPAEPPSPPADADLDLGALSDRARALVDLVSSRNLRGPDDVGVRVVGYEARIDLVYRVDGLNTAIVVDGPHRQPDPGVLAFYGWNVVHVRLDDDLDTVVSSHPAVFGMEML
jgi:hypothetical protein